MIFHNSRAVVAPSERTLSLLFHVRTSPADGWREHECRACSWTAWLPPTAARERPSLPDAHVCPEEGRHRCTCTTTLFVVGLRRLYLDGDHPDCPVHGGGEAYGEPSDPEPVARVTRPKPRPAAVRVGPEPDGPGLGFGRAP